MEHSPSDYSQVHLDLWQRFVDFKLGLEVVQAKKSQHSPPDSFFQIIHAVSLTAAFVIAALGLSAKWKENGLAGLFSLHSWLGFGLVLLFGIQVISHSNMNIVIKESSVVCWSCIIFVITCPAEYPSQGCRLSPSNGNRDHYINSSHCRYRHRRKNVLQGKDMRTSPFIIYSF